MNDIKSPNHQLLLQIFKYLSPKRRAQICILLILMVGSAVSELVSLGAVMPFLSVLAEPKNLLSLEWLSNMSVFARISSADQMILVVTILFVLASIISALIRLMTLRYGFYLSASIGSDLPQT